MRGWSRVAQACPHPGPLPALQKLQLVLAPLHSLASRALEHGLPDPGSLLAHSLQQLDRIDSLSEQISLLEEQLGSCESLRPTPCTHGGPAASDTEAGPVPAQRPEGEVGQLRPGRKVGEL